MAGFAGSLHWALDLASHFPVQYAVALTPATLVLFLLRRRRWAAVCGSFAVVNLTLIAPLYLAASDQPPEGSPRFRALLANVFTSNTRSNLVLDCIRRHDPDFVVLQEVDARWMSDLAPLRRSHPHVFAEPRGDNCGIALFSKLPLAKCEIVRLDESQVPSLLAKFKIGGKGLTLLSAHPLAPAGWWGWKCRNEQLEAIPAFLRAQTNGADHVLVLADLNATPWCTAFRRLVRDTGLRDSALGFGVQPSWPTAMRMSRPQSLLMSIPIDHCLVSDNLFVTGRKTGEYIGSDHFPLIVDVAMER